MAITLDKIFYDPAKGGSAVYKRCRVYRAGAQNINASVYTKILLETVKFDPDSCFDVANNRIIIPNTGCYFITGAIAYTPTADSHNWYILLYKNGVVFTQGYIFYRYIGSKVIVLAGDIIEVNKDDYIELYALTDLTSDIITGDGFTYLALHSLSIS